MSTVSFDIFDEDTGETDILEADSDLVEECLDFAKGMSGAWDIEEIICAMMATTLVLGEAERGELH